MKKNVLNQIEKIKKERKISEEVDKKIKDRIIVNAAICIALIMLILTYMVSANVLPKEGTRTLYNLSSILFLTFTIVVFEIGYKKDSGKLAISGVELLAFSIFILFAPYIFLRFNYTVIYGAIIVLILYYTIKIIRIYQLEKNTYIKANNDIQEIIKKESKDELAKEYELKRQEELEKAKKKKIVKENNKSAKTKKQTPKKKTQTKKVNKDIDKKNNKTTTNKKTTKSTSTKKTTTKTKNNKQIKENK